MADIKREFQVAQYPKCSQYVSVHLCQIFGACIIKCTIGLLCCPTTNSTLRPITRRVTGSTWCGSVQFSSSAVNTDMSVMFVLMMLTTVITIVIVLTGNASSTSASTETEAASALALHDGVGGKNLSHTTVL